MGYGEQSLGQNEKLIYEAHFHGSYFPFFFIFLSLHSLYSHTHFFSSPFSSQMIPIWTTEIAVTNHRLVVKRGWLTRSTSELQLKSIEQVNFHQGLLGRLFDFGRIDIHGTGVDDLRLPNIGCPKDLLKAIENASIPLKTAAAAA